MKTLSHLQNEAIERFEEKFHIGLFATENYQGKPDELEFKIWQTQQTNNANARKELLKNFLKTELTNIVKESFKNTRVEENGKHNAKCEHDNNWCCTHAEELIDDEYTEYGYNTALSDKQEMENQFLNN